MTRFVVQRFLICIVLGILIAIGINESTFIFMKSEAGRGPQKIELVIPAGTAEKVARGEADPSLPKNMVFVAGDTLVVKNQDAENHTLGPLFIPSGTTATLTLNDASNFAYSCSFEPTKVFGLDVREPVTGATRLSGIMFAGLPLGLMLGIYSLVIWPFKKKEPVTA